MQNIKVWQIIALGLLLIIVGNGFHYELVNVHLNKLIADVGALLVVIGALQFAFDEHARGILLKSIRELISSTEWLLRAGIDRATDRSHSIVEFRDELVLARELTIGVHYSNNSIDRYTEVIRDRIQTKRKTLILMSAEDGPGLAYLQAVLGPDTNLRGAVSKLESFIRRNFESSDLVETKKTPWLLRYNFIATESAIWVIFSPNTPGRVQRIPAVRTYNGSPIFNFFRHDIEALCKDAIDAKTPTTS